MRGYDDQFQELCEDLQPAIRGGFVVIADTPRVHVNTASIFGPPPSPSEWASTESVLMGLRGLIIDEVTLREAARGVGDVHHLQSQERETLAPAGRMFDVDLGVAFLSSSRAWLHFRRV
ncbi:MAG: hypothetical protein EOO73_36255 [Myxococcales bacterium]|nr:MAG: hypothetical protein EOO73_36255 [Myxococcales bacterium]